MKKSESQKDILKRLRKGDLVAFDKIYQQYAKRLYGFVFNFVKNESDTEEILQEVFIAVWESRENIDVNGSFNSYIFRITYNKTLNVLRSKITEKKFIHKLEYRQQIIDTDEILNNIQFKELNDKVNELVNQLSTRQREIFKLSREEGLSLGEIAQKLNISDNTAKNHLVSALKFLKTKLHIFLIASMICMKVFL